MRSRAKQMMFASEVRARGFLPSWAWFPIFTRLHFHVSIFPSLFAEEPII